MSEMEEDRGMVGNFVLQVNRNLMPFLSVSSYWGMFLGCEQVAGNTCSRLPVQFVLKLPG